MNTYDVSVPGRTWFLCGDSTMADYPAARAPMTGWGQALRELLPAGERAVNLAVCGRSSKSFIDEGRLEALEPQLRKGDVLVISFGHNDEKADPARHTTPWDSYPRTLLQYIEAARRHGAEPVLVTPIARRHFDEHGHPLFTHGEYPAAMRALAKREDLRLVDLEAATMALLEALGPEESKRLYCHVPAGHPNYPDGAKDDSHLHRRGAVRFAGLFLSLLRGDQVTRAAMPAQFRAASGDWLTAEDESVGYPTKS